MGCLGRTEQPVQTGARQERIRSPRTASSTAFRLYALHRLHSRAAGRLRSAWNQTESRSPSRPRSVRRCAGGEAPHGAAFRSPRSPRPGGARGGRAGGGEAEARRCPADGCGAGMRALRGAALALLLAAALGPDAGRPHPQCLDFKPPFRPPRALAFCRRYGAFGCCDSRRDRALLQRFYRLSAHLDGPTYSACAGHLQDLLCQVRGLRLCGISRRLGASGVAAPVHAGCSGCRRGRGRTGIGTAPRDPGQRCTPCWEWGCQPTCAPWIRQQQLPLARLLWASRPLDLI